MSDNRTSYTDPNRTDPNRPVASTEISSPAYTEPNRSNGLPLGQPASYGRSSTLHGSGPVFGTLDMAAGVAWAVMNLGPLVAAAIIGH